MTKRKNIFLFILFLLILAAGFYWWSKKNKTETPEKTAELEVFQETNWFIDEKNKFKFLPPEGWFKDEEKGENLVVRFTAQKREAVKAGELIANINAIVKTVESQSDKEKFLDKEIEILSANFPQFKLIKKEALPEAKGFLIEGEFKKGTSMIHFLQRVAFQNGKIFILTGTTFADQWKEYSEIIKVSLDSFELL